MKALLTVFVALLVVMGAVPQADAGGRKGGGSSYKSSSKRSSSWGGGTGSKSSSTRVRGYTTKRGTYVAPYRKTTPDRTQRNNYSTKSNYNPYTGRTGTKRARY